MKILIVDDDRLCRELLKQMLRAYGERQFAEDGLIALSAMHAAWDAGQPFDLVCLDIQMPNCNGQDALQAIRQAEAERGISEHDAVKVIMTSAFDDMQNLTSAFSLGCQSYVCKPIDEDVLKAELRNMGLEPLEQSPGGESEPPLKYVNIGRGETAESASDNAAALRILIVDDDRLCRELMRRILGQFGQCDVAEDGKEGIAAFHIALEDGQGYDLVCLDIMMPEVDGHETLLGIRKLEDEFGITGLAGAKVIMTTALHDSKHCIRAFREGCECYHTKPINEAELVCQMQKLGLLAPQHA